MHYRNGREAKNGDKIVRLKGGTVEAFGILHSAKADGGSHCNGMIAIMQSTQEYACLCDCLHVEDLAQNISDGGLEIRPQGM